MTTDAAVDQIAQQWVDRIRSLAPIVEAHRDESEMQRHLAPEIVAAMRERDLFCTWLPKSLGGNELPIEISIRIMEELSRLDGAAGWSSMISSNHSILWSHVAHDVAASMTEGGRTVIAGTIGGGGDRSAPGGGLAIAVPGGYRITGKWGFASGCHHADWMVANGRISENGDLRKGPNGNVGLFSFLIAPSEVRILDTWYTTGMRGTGSHHFEGEDIFVPEERVFSTASPATYEPSLLYSTSRSTPWSANIAGVAIGIARDAIDSFLDLARVKPASVGRSSLLERDSIHRAVGEAEGRLRGARLFLLETARNVDACIARSGPIPDEAAAMMRCATATASLVSREVVDMVYEAAGSSSIYMSNRLDRCFRDVHTTISHAVGGINGLPVAGRYFLGLGLQQM
jgi:alkylation response protein AidB-like acyl-CoA dehydrogenase